LPIVYQRRHSDISDKAALRKDSIFESEIVLPEDSVSQSGEVLDTDPWDGGEAMRSEVASEAASASHMSIVSGCVGVPHCYLPCTCFKDPNEKFVAVEQLVLYQQILSVDGEVLRVVAFHEEPEQEREVVFLETGDARLIVTACHRVMVQRRNQQIAIPASALHDHDDVICSTGVQKLTNVQRQEYVTKVFEVKFDPDKSVETFNLPSDMILTRGHQGRKTRRSGMGTRHQTSSHDQLSIPDTMSVWE